MTIHTLPNELILLISRNLPPPDLFHLLQTNRQLYNLLSLSLIDTIFDSRSGDHAKGLLYSAASRGDAETISALIQRGILDIAGPDLMHNAVLRQPDIVIRTLLEADTDMLIELEEWSEDGRTPLHLAAMYGFTQIVEMLLEREDVDPGFPDVCDMTPLVLAVVGGQEDVVHLLLARGADVNGDLESTSRTPLQAATIYGYVSIVKTLLKHPDIAPDQYDEDQNNALHYAVMHGRNEIAKLLIKDGRIDVNLEGEHDYTALHFAATTGNVEIVRLLMEVKNLIVGPHSALGESPLHKAIAANSIGVVRLLLKDMRVDVNEKDHDGNTCLKLARRNEEIKRLLLERIFRCIGSKGMNAPLNL